MNRPCSDSRSFEKSSDQSGLSGWKWILPVGAMTMPLGWNGHHLRADQLHPAIIDRIAEHRSGKVDFAGREGAGALFIGTRDSAAELSRRASSTPLAACARAAARAAQNLNGGKST